MSRKECPPPPEYPLPGGLETEPTTWRILQAEESYPFAGEPNGVRGSSDHLEATRPFAHHESLFTTNFENSLFSHFSFLHSVCLIRLSKIPLQTRGFLPSTGNQRANYLGLEMGWGGAPI